MLRDFRPTDRSAVVALYEQAFPASERLPLDVVLGPGREVVVAVDEGDAGGVVGLAVMVPLTGATLLEYLAVDAARRSGGVGGRLVDHVVRHSRAERVLAELEPTSSSPDAQRRASFYRRHGFAPAPWHRGYAMPGPDGAALPMELWEAGGAGRPADGAALVRDLYRRVYGDRGTGILDDVLLGTVP